MQRPNDQLSALLRELDVTGAEYRTAVRDLNHTIARGNDIRASERAFLAANQAANLAQQRYRSALDAYKEHFRVARDGSAPTRDAPATPTLH